jgi:hypothetical protein
LDGDQPVARPLPTHKTTQTQNERTQTFMPRMEFEPTIPAFERAKTVHASDRADTLIAKGTTIIVIIVVLIVLIRCVSFVIELHD